MANGNGRHKIRVGWCPISECPACFPDGCRCGYRMDNVACMHPVYRRRWREAVMLDEDEEDVDQVEAGPVRQTLTARVSKARRAGAKMTPEAARAKLQQLGLGLEVV